MSRPVPEWIARHENEAIPPRVKLRIFQKFNKRCAVCTLLIVGKLRPEYDDVTALINGGAPGTQHPIALLCVSQGQDQGGRRGKVRRLPQTTECRSDPKAGTAEGTRIQETATATHRLTSD